MTVVIIFEIYKNLFMTNFWTTLPSPFFVLAPMEDVTDVVFRKIVRDTNLGSPQVLFTEFTNCDGICSVGQSKVIHRLKYDPVRERPIVAQIWGKTPKNYEETARLCLKLGFDGIDINMGCPEKSVVKQGACSALINNKPLASEIIEATKVGTNGQIPVSVKTRIGFGNIVTEDWSGFLLDQNIEALTVHGRTVSGDHLEANWSEIQKVVKIRDKNLHNSKKHDIISKLKQKWLDHRQNS
jgi:tRNA-dihydrouridine synthase